MRGGSRQLIYSMCFLVARRNLQCHLVFPSVDFSVLAAWPHSDRFAPCGRIYSVMCYGRVDVVCRCPVLCMCHAHRRPLADRQSRNMQYVLCACSGAWEAVWRWSSRCSQYNIVAFTLNGSQQRVGGMQAVPVPRHQPRDCSGSCSC